MSGEPQDSARSTRLFRLLLRAYPQDFRDRYGEEATQLFRDRRTEAEAKGAMATVYFWLRTLPHTLGHGLLERWTQRRVSGGNGPVRAASHALRTLRRSPAQSATIVLTLALGIGANVALFSVLRGVVLTPLPFPDAERLVQLWERNPAVDDERHGPSPWNFVDWSLGETDFESMTAWYLTSGTYRTDDWAEELRSAQVTADFFTVLGVEPALGRSFRPEEVSGYGPVMLSHRTWTRLFGADSSVVGRMIVSSGNSYEIVGVMPEGFTFPDPSVETWVAWDLPSAYAELPEARTWRFLQGLARLDPEVSPDQAEGSLARISASLAATYPEANGGWGTELTPLHDEIVGPARATLWAAFGAVLILLLVACANVANLLLAAVPTRSRELAIRTSLGASRRRVASELVLQYGVLAFLAGALGLAFGTRLLDLLTRLDAGGIPRLSEVSIDAGVVAFAAALSGATALLFGVAPALGALDGAVADTLRGGLRATASRRQRQNRETFVASQVALAILLLAAAAALLQSFDRLRTADYGMNPEQVATFRVSLDPVEGTAKEIVQYYDGLVDALEKVPDVIRVGGAQTLPLDPVAGDFQRPYRSTGATVDAGDAPVVNMRIVTPGYRDAIGMRLLAGQDLPADARLGEPLVALVNETLAAALWPDGAAVDRSFEIDFREGWQPYRIVGVVQDVAHQGVRATKTPEVFLSHAQVPYLAMTMVARGGADPDRMMASLRDAALTYRSGQPPHHFITMERLLADSMATERFLSTFIGVFAAIALLLAATGIYGVISYVVSHQRREIGVRIALGARRTDVVRSVAGRAMTVVSIGALIGASTAWVTGGVLDTLLYDVSATDPIGLVVIAMGLLVVAAAAATMPAIRAARIPPADALRAD